MKTPVDDNATLLSVIVDMLGLTAFIIGACGVSAMFVMFAERYLA